MHGQALIWGLPQLHFSAYAQTDQSVYLGGITTAEADMTAEIRRRRGAAWSAFRRYANVIYDRPTVIVPMVLKVRMLQAEVREDLLYGCSTWTLLTRENDLLRTQHHRLLRCVGVQKRQPSNHPLSYAATLAMTGCESVETTILKTPTPVYGFPSPPTTRPPP